MWWYTFTSIFFPLSRCLCVCVFFSSRTWFARTAAIVHYKRICTGRSGWKTNDTHNTNLCKYNVMCARVARCGLNERLKNCWQQMMELLWTDSYYTTYSRSVIIAHLISLLVHHKLFQSCRDSMLLAVTRTRFARLFCMRERKKIKSNQNHYFTVVCMVCHCISS